MLNTNSSPWEDRLEALLRHDQRTEYELEPVKPSIAYITLVTDESRRVHVYVNGKLKSRSWDLISHRERFVEVMEMIHRELKKHYHIIKVDAFLPYIYLRNLYFPSQKIPYIKRVRSYLFK